MLHGAYILGSYIVWRYGEGVTDSRGNVPCTISTAWTECCTHRKYVFICDSFARLTPEERTITVIHEALHVAGQKEDRTTSFGPGDPPTSSQIQANVRAACQ